jgi:hypothetical protein
MTTEQLPCLRINCAEWYERLNFRRWLNAGLGHGLATWHPGGNVGDYGDVFLVYDVGECGEVNGCPFPADIWEEVCRLCAEAGLSYGVIWLTNMQ